MTSDSAQRLVCLATSVATLVCLFVVSPRTVYAQLTPTEAAEQMDRGINLGNSLEPPAEGALNNGPDQEYYFDDYLNAGFSTVCTPVRWDGHTSNSARFTVNAARMSRVEQLVNLALDRNLFVIINAHHEDWLKQNYADPVSRARFDSIWEQVSERFQNTSEKLFFEIINEPNGLTRNEVDELRLPLAVPGYCSGLDSQRVTLEQLRPSYPQLRRRTRLGWWPVELHLLSISSGSDLV